VIQSYKGTAKEIREKDPSWVHFLANADRAILRNKINIIKNKHKGEKK